jgi:hypothetical protein
VSFCAIEVIDSANTITVVARDSFFDKVVPLNLKAGIDNKNVLQKLGARAQDRHRSTIAPPASREKNHETTKESSNSLLKVDSFRKTL